MVYFCKKPNNHISLKHGCPKCKSDKLSSLYSISESEFIEKASKVHNKKYDYSKVNYSKSTGKIIIGCNKHGYFKRSTYKNSC